MAKPQTAGGEPWLCVNWDPALAKEVLGAVEGGTRTAPAMPALICAREGGQWLRMWHIFALFRSIRKIPE